MATNISQMNQTQLKTSFNGGLNLMQATLTQGLMGQTGGGSRIKVAVRVRPLLENERNQGHQCTILKYTNQNEIQIAANDDPNNGGQRAKNFRFDQVFTHESTQAEMYQGLGISNLVSKVIEGYHGTIFAYGQTGSGKTFTMEGYDFVSNFGDQPNKTKAIKPSNDSENIGITQRSIFELFQQIDAIKQSEQKSGTGHIKHYSVFCSFLQIYNEKVFDLLNSSSISSLSSKKVAGGGAGLDLSKQMQGLRIRWTKKDQFVVENLYVFECSSPEEAIELFKFGSKNRVLASHNLNDLSSRSHTIFTLTVESQDLKHAAESVTVSKLQLVDLAGSEKQGLTGTTGQQAKESIDINKSLLVLRKVITALTEQKTDSKLGMMGTGGFIPYRESKLTCLLKQSLGGNSYTLMIACLSPSDRYLEENLSTLNYAAKASLISNIPTKNVDPRLMEINEYKRKIHDLEKELRSANDHIQFLTQLNDEKANKLQSLENQFRQLQMNPNLMKQGSDSTKDTYGDSKLPMINKNYHSATRQQRSEIQKEDVQSLNLSDYPSGIANNDNDFNARSIISPNKTSYNSNPMNQSFVNQSQSMLSQSNQKRQTQLNFFLQKDKEKQDAAAERLIHSVNAVTDLLKANTELRDTIEKLKNQKEEVDGEVFGLQIENQSLRERLELVEGILKNNRENYDVLVSDKVKDNMLKSNTQYGKFTLNSASDQAPTTIDAVYNELIQLRHKNKALEGRIKQLEVQNFRITNQNFTSAKKKNNEPSRPIFRGANEETADQAENQGHVQEEDDEDDEDNEQDYDEEEEDEDEAQEYSQVPGHSNKSRSFIVTIDEHKGSQILQKHKIKKAQGLPLQMKQGSIMPNKRVNQVNIARGDPYLKKITLQQQHPQSPIRQRGQYRDSEQQQYISHHQSMPQTQQNNLSQVVPDQRFYTKTNFFTVNQDDHAQRLGTQSIAEKYQQRVVSSDYVSDNDQATRNQHENMSGAVQPPIMNHKMQQNSMREGNAIIGGQGNLQYESDFQSINDMNRRTKIQLQPINESKGVTDLEFKQFQQQQKLKKKRRDGSSVNNNISMVMVMSNLMSKRSGQSQGGQGLIMKKKGGNSLSVNQKKPKYINNEFYF